ncbi:polysaccharide deacetylase family protein [Altererythrobacter sp. C41]|uniref:polysaccharide deacetylase family protein n=1 Tax=Altererythrobacter sp. C41 TaxID=2806021 RepID=UPI00193239D1|nr:polysaccharide deacetylase family protein [Altererythrobacter sp. C41]MBM0169162.1 polysaccharide deacetylase family protein [Altererythrobacter sp. C41]
MNQPTTALPPPGPRARFVGGFGRRVLLTVDTEEEFDWSGPFTRDRHGLDHLPRLRNFQEFCEGLGVVPSYLVDWPVATSSLAKDILAGPVARGTAEVGIQLHPWVNPPFEEEVSERNSFAGNLAPDIERAKFLRLRDAIAENFGASPQLYRAGRYGFGPETAELLRDAGVGVDTSFRPLFDYSRRYGPDYSGYPLEPFWLDRERSVLELPLTTVYWGMLRRQGQLLYPMIARMPRMSGLLAKLGLLERIPLTPEGTTIDEAIRALDMALDDGLPLIVLSFHSPSLAPGYTPYVETDADLDALYDWFRAVYAYLGQHGVQPTSVAEIMRSVAK